jgi:hypothetical protein
MKYNTDKLRGLIALQDSLYRELSDLDKKIQEARIQSQRVQNNLKQYDNEPPQHLIEETKRRLNIFDKYTQQRITLHHRWSNQASLVTNCQSFLLERGVSPDPDYSMGTVTMGAMS